MQIFYISLFGVLGILSRYSIDLLFKNINSSFPYSTLLINILGSFLIGLLWHDLTPKISIGLQQALIIGFCGGFTTFSSFTIQLLNTQQNEGLLKALIYLSSSLIMGVFACYFGLRLSKPL